MGRKKTLCREWLTRGVRVAAAAGGADGRTGVSGVLGWLAGPAVRSRELGRSAAARASWAGWLLLRASGLSRPSQLRAFFFSLPFSILFFFSFV